MKAEFPTPSIGAYPHPIETLFNTDQVLDLKDPI